MDVFGILKQWVINKQSWGLSEDVILIAWVKQSIKTLDNLKTCVASKHKEDRTRKVRFSRVFVELSNLKQYAVKRCAENVYKQNERMTKIFRRIHLGTNFTRK